MVTPIPDLNTSGLDSVIVGVATAVPIFIPALLMFIFFIIAITGYMKQRQEGYADISQWCVVSGIVTSIVALILSMVPNVINISTLISTIVITIAFGIWFISSGDRQ